MVQKYLASLSCLLLMNFSLPIANTFVWAEAKSSRSIMAQGAPPIANPSPNITPLSPVSATATAVPSASPTPANTPSHTVQPAPLILNTVSLNIARTGLNYDSLQPAIPKTPCTQPVINQISGNSGTSVHTFFTNSASTSEDILRASLATQGSVIFGLAKVDASTNFNHTSNQSNNSISLVVIGNIDGGRENVTKFELFPRYASILKGQEPEATRTFLDTCGDAYIATTFKGASFAVKVSITTSDSSLLNEFGVHGGGGFSLGPIASASAKADFDGSFSSTNRNTNLSIDVYSTSPVSSDALARLASAQTIEQVEAGVQMFVSGQDLKNAPAIAYAPANIPEVTGGLDGLNALVNRLSIEHLSMLKTVSDYEAVADKDLSNYKDLDDPNSPRSSALGSSRGKVLQQKAALSQYRSQLDQIYSSCQAAHSTFLNDCKVQINEPQITEPLPIYPTRSYASSMHLVVDGTLLTTSETVLTLAPTCRKTPLDRVDVTAQCYGPVSQNAALIYEVDHPYILDAAAYIGTLSGTKVTSTACSIWAKSTLPKNGVVPKYSTAFVISANSANGVPIASDIDPEKCANQYIREQRAAIKDHSSWSKTFLNQRYRLWLKTADKFGGGIQLFPLANIWIAGNLLNYSITTSLPDAPNVKMRH